MVEKDQQNQDFDLEDILREFGGQDATPSPEPEEPPVLEEPALPEEEPSEESFPESYEQDAPEPDEPAPDELEPHESEPDESEPLEEPEEAAWEDAPSPEMSQDTVRLDELSQVRESMPPVEDTYREMPPPPEPKVEPFSQNWEPEYEEPMGTYVPPQPITFRTKSRLGELKRKLIAGPEKRYYELTEMGLGRLQLVIFLSVVVLAVSIATTAMYAMDMIPENRMKLMVYGQFLALLLSALLGSFQMIDGVADLFRGKFTLNTMLACTFAACCVDAILGLQELRVPCCAAFGLQVTMSLWAEYHRKNTEMGQMDTMRKAIRLDSVVCQPDYYEGKTGILRGEGQVEDFMDHYTAPSTPERVMNWYALAALLAALAAAVTAGLLHGFSMGVQVLSVSLLAAVPASAFISLTRPMSILERRFHRLGTVLCGWDGVKALSGKAAFPLFYSDLFPGRATKMNGVKFYGSRDPDQVVAYAASVIEADGGGLASLFNKLLDSRNGRHYDTLNLNTYEGGVGGEVNGEPVLVGTLPFMRDMGVEIPDGTRVSQAVYVAVDGELCGLFAISCDKVSDAAAGLTTLCAYRSLTPVLVTNDFLLSASFLRGRFGINPRRIAFPQREERTELANRRPDPDCVAAALTTQEGLAPAAFAVTGAKSLRTASIIGVVVHMLGGVVGLVMMAVLAVLGASQLLTPVNMLLYELIWMIPGFLVTEWTRAV